MSAQRRAHHVARGHNRIIRVVEVNDPAPEPDPLETVFKTLYERFSEPLICKALVENFGCVLTFEDLAVAAWGDTPAVRESSKLRSVRQHSISSYVSHINARLLLHKMPYRIVSVRGVGYRMEDGKHTKPRKYTPRDRGEMLQKMAYLKATRPGMSERQICRRLGLNQKTLSTWRARGVLTET